MCHDGYGLTIIAKTLNGDSKYADLSAKYLDGWCPPPPSVANKIKTNSEMTEAEARAEFEKAQAWWPSTVQKHLTNGGYTGNIPYLHTEKYYVHGTKKRKHTDHGIKVPAPELCIISRAVFTRLRRN